MNEFGAGKHGFKDLKIMVVRKSLAGKEAIVCNFLSQPINNTFEFKNLYSKEIIAIELVQGT